MLPETENNLVVFFGGIGDVLTWVPALKAMRVKPDVLYLNGTPLLSILKENDLVNEVYQVEGKFALMRFAIAKRAKYDNVFLNHLCGGRLLLSGMRILSHRVFSNSENFGHASGNFIQRDILKGVHDSVQNFFLLHGRKPDLVADSFALKVQREAEKPISPYLCIHLAAGNGQTPYKNWSMKNWAEFIDLLQKELPQFTFVLLGGKEETMMADQLVQFSVSKWNKVGRTSLNEAASLISGAKIFIGPDGGLMHLSVCMGIRTFTLWGASSQRLYGYQELFPSDHQSVSLQLPCSPCNAWQDPNRSRTSDPLTCSDFACMRDLKPPFVLQRFLSFFRSELGYNSE